MEFEKTLLSTPKITFRFPNNHTVSLKIRFLSSKSRFCDKITFLFQNHVLLRKNHVFCVKITFFASKLILDEGFRASRYHHEQELDERFLMVVFSFNFDKLE